MSEWIEVKKEEDKKEETKMWDPSVAGDSIQGIYIDREENVGQFKSKMYTLDTSEGEVKLWGSTVLDNLMDEVPFDCEVRITFQGTQPSKSGRNPWKDYKVEYRK